MGFLFFHHSTRMRGIKVKLIKILSGDLRNSTYIILWLLTDIWILYDISCKLLALHKNWIFPLRIFPANVTKSTNKNVTKSAGNCGFGHNLLEKFLIENFVFCAVLRYAKYVLNKSLFPNQALNHWNIF